MKPRASVALVVGLAIVSAPACGIRQHFFGKPTPTRPGTLTAAPPTGPPGTRFSLVAGGFLPGESMTFEIDVPGQKPFVGPAHTAGTDGSVTSSYMPQSGDPPGTYQVKAVGARGTRAQTSVVIVAAQPATSSG